jgi:ATP-dependent phosphoenolpyruvate carboxykinase
LAALLDGKLVLISGAAGSLKLDTAKSLDLFGLAAKHEFTEKMKGDGVTLLEAFEAWADKQAVNMELAQSLDRLAQNFESLLKVMDTLYQVNSSKGLAALQPAHLYWDGLLQCSC